jgi:hypothetical protein
MNGAQIRLKPRAGYLAIVWVSARHIHKVKHSSTVTVNMGERAKGHPSPDSSLTWLFATFADPPIVGEHPVISDIVIPIFGHRRSTLCSDNFHFNRSNRTTYTLILEEMAEILHSNT